MSIFSRFAQKANPDVVTNVAPTQEDGVDTEVAVVPVIDDKPGTITDPLEVVPVGDTDTPDDEFAEQRKNSGSEEGTESLTEQAVQTEAPTQEVEQTAEIIQSDETQTADITNVDAAVSQEGEPVDGANEDHTVGTTDTDVELPVEPTHTNEPERTETGNDVAVDADDSEVNFDQIDQELDQFEAEELQVADLSQEIAMLGDAAFAVEQFGSDQSSIAIMQITGLLSGTALESLGLECVTASGPKGAESMLAVEALGDKIKEKTAQWSAKVMNVVDGAGKKFLSIVEPLWEKISGTIKTLGNASWDKAKAGGRAIKAHPYRTAATVVAAIMAVGTIVAFAASGAPAPAAKIDVIKAYLKELASKISSIKWPFGKVNASVSENGLKLLTSVEGPKGVFGVADTKTVSELGWSAQAAKALGGQLERALDAVKKGWGVLGAKAMDLAKTAGGFALKVAADGVAVGAHAGTAAHNTARAAFGSSTAAKVASTVVGIQAQNLVAGTYIMFVIGVITGLFNLARKIVIGGLRMIGATLRALVPGTAATA